jgi:hypothetical protein
MEITMTISETPWKPRSPQTLSEAPNKVHCPKCGAKPGKSCRWTASTHLVRLYVYEMDYGVTQDG